MYKTNDTYVCIELRNIGFGTIVSRFFFLIDVKEWSFVAEEPGALEWCGTLCAWWLAQSLLAALLPSLVPWLTFCWVCWGVSLGLVICLRRTRRGPAFGLLLLPRFGVSLPVFSHGRAFCNTVSLS